MKNQKNWLHMAVVVIPLTLVIFLVILFHNRDFMPDSIEARKIVDEQRFYYIGIVLFTALLAWIAWVQMYNLNKIDRMSFLLRIDDRYGSQPILQARAIIERLYNEISETSQNLNKGILELVSEEVKKYNHNITKESALELALLLNLLDFLQTIAYFLKEEQLKPNEFLELFGRSSFIFYYKAYTELIIERRKVFNDYSYCKQFEEVALEFMNSKHIEKLQH